MIIYRARNLQHVGHMLGARHSATATVSRIPMLKRAVAQWVRDNYFVQSVQEHALVHYLRDKYAGIPPPVHVFRVPNNQAYLGVLECGPKRVILSRWDSKIIQLMYEDPDLFGRIQRFFCKDGVWCS